MSTRFTLLSVALLAAPASAQSLNVDLGPTGSQAPSSSYGAAGLPGYWNSAVAPHTTPSTSPQAGDQPLLDLHGNPTGVGLHQFGGQDWIASADPALSGGDAQLMSDALITHSISLKSCLYFNGLENGVYEVLMYTWFPTHPEVTSVSFIDTVPGQEFAGGAWSGGHVEGVTYTRFLVNVTNGFMGPHAGLPAGGNTTLGGPLNGIQLRKLCQPASYCMATANSTGFSAAMQTSDDCHTLSTGFTLTASPVPDEPGLFYFGTTQIQQPFGDGFRCVGGSTVRIWPPTFAAGGVLERSVDFGDAATGGLIAPGSTWSFQAWYRDPAGAGSGFNLSDAISVTFD